MTITAKELLHSESEMESSTALLSLGISEHSPLSTPQAIEAWLMSLQQDSHANHLVPLESKEVQTTSAICGQQHLKSSEPLDQSAPSWKTSQDSWVSIDTLRQSSRTFPKRGMMRAGFACPLPKLERLTSESGCGYWPTPTTQEVEHPDMVLTATGRRLSKNGKTSHSVGLADAVKIWSTPRATDWQHCIQADAAKKARTRGFQPNLGEQVAETANGGRLNPTWVEWLMGWPLGATDLNPLEMDKYQQFLQKHGES